MNQQRTIVLKAFAKINLGLSVIGRRADGYHELRTILQTVSLADSIAVELIRGRGPVQLKATGFKVPEGRDNLAVRAAEAMRKELVMQRGIAIRLRKRIPPGSGLGGASSDAASVLRAVLALSGKSLSAERMLHLAASLGSDVPFFLMGGRAVGLGRGEEIYALPEQARRYVVIHFPGEGMSTAEAYRLLRRPRLTGPVAPPTIELFCSHAARPAAVKLSNDFESLLVRRIPQLAGAKRLLLRSGAETAALTGSGSALFGLFQDPGDARRAACALRRLGASTWFARTVSRRESARAGAAWLSS